MRPKSKPSIGRGVKRSITKALLQQAPTKYLDTDFSGVFVENANWATSYIMNLVDVTEGFTVNERIGHDITLMAVRLDGSISFQQDEGLLVGVNPPPWVKFRILVVLSYDYFSSGNQTEVLGPADSSNFGYIDWFENPSVLGRYKILHDQVIDFRSNSPCEVFNNSGVDNFYYEETLKKFSISLDFNYAPIPIHFSTAVGNSQDQNNLYVLANYVREYADSVANLTLSVRARAYYKDL